MTINNQGRKSDGANIQSLVAARRRRWETILAPEAPPGFMFIIRWPDTNAPGTPPSCYWWPEKAKERIEYKWQAYQRTLEKIRMVNDDALPYLDMITGTEIFAEAFGCPVARPTNDAPFAQPLIADASEVSRLQVPELSRSSLSYLFDMADELRRRAPDALLGIVDVQSPMDIAALIWNKTAFFMAMVDNPEAVRELADKVYTLLTAFLDEWFRRYERDFIAHCPNYYMPQGITLSEDEAGSVNAEMFESLFLPELQRLSDRYGGFGMHCCANARHQWPNFLKIRGLRLLNLSNPPKRKLEEYLIPAYTFFEKTCVQWHGGWAPSGAMETWPNQWPRNARVVLDIPAKDVDEAARLADQLQVMRQKLY